MIYKKRTTQHSYTSKKKNGAQAPLGSKNSVQRFKRRKATKKLDINLFIKKASVNKVPAYTPQQAFLDFALVEKLQRNIATHGYTYPTQIQEQTIPYLLAGRDVIGIANTGTGKTAAFLIPLVNKIFQNRNERVLIMTPTRELAMQIADELLAFTKGMDLETVVCIGGASLDRQAKKLRHTPHFVIGTPGRLKDLIQRRTLQLGLFHNIVLDEVDRMVDIGFIHEVKYFISLLPHIRQSLFFSATITDKVKEILQSFVTNPITVSVKMHATAENVDQDIVRVNGDSNKINMLHELLTHDGFDKVMVFGRTKWGIEKLTDTLIARGFSAVSIHGNKSQGQRHRSLLEFKTNKAKILLATDVASRGLDIQNVTHVINYDAPDSYDDYVHRIGRTGRAGKSGKAITFVE